MILVTGGTGTVGGELVKLLAERGTSFRVLVRSPQKAKVLETQHIEAVVGDLQDPASLDRALNSVSRLFLLSPSHHRQVRLQLQAIEAAKRAGVGYVVKVSAIGAGPDAPIKLGRDHGNIEQAIREAGFRYTFLRPAAYMQNLLNAVPVIAAKGEFYGAMGEGKTPMIDGRDIGAAAAAALTTHGHEGKIYTLTGPQALSYQDVAAILSKTVGHPVTYVNLSSDQFKAGLIQAGLPEWLAEDLVTIESAWASGHTEEISDAIPLITGRAARTFAEFARDYRAAFRGAA